MSDWTVQQGARRDCFGHKIVRDEGGAKLNVGSVTMPAGTYYVGDPCYSVPDDRWMEWLQAADYLNEHRYLLAEIDGLPVLGIGTAHGDGEYAGSDGNSYPVDAGLIGLVPVEVVRNDATEDGPWGTQLVRFDRPFECSYDAGAIVLGDIEIDTDSPSDGEL